MLPRHSVCKGSAGSGLIVGRGGRPGGQASRNIRTRHYARPRGDAAHYPGALRRRASVRCAAWHPARRCAVPWCGPVAVGRDGCPSGLPTRAAAPSARCAAWHCAKNSYRAITHAIFARALPGRRDGDIAPYRHYTRNIRTPPLRTATGHAITHARCPLRASGT